MIEIDGSFGEGGGQILRYALVYSIFLNKPFKIYNIRKGRPNPGLKSQHLNILKALKMISDSEVKGDEIGSLEVEFKPGKIKGGNIFLDFRTAGSISLFLQTIFPVGIFSKEPIYLHLKGGTDVPGAPTIDYFENVIVKIVSRIIEKFEMKILKRGYYPKGGGEVKIFLKGKKSLYDFNNFKDFRKFLKENLNLNFEGGKLLEINGIISSSNILKEKKVCERMKEVAEKILISKGFRNFHFKYFYEDSISPGCSFTIWGEMENNGIVGNDILCKKGVPSEKIAEDCVNEFIDISLNNSVDYHLSDNLVLWLSLAGGKIKLSKKTEHFKTAIFVAKKFLDFDFLEKGDNLIFLVNI